MLCPWVGDGRGRTQEEIWEDGGPGQPGAAVYRHTLDRVNAINDSLKKKKKAP